MCWVKSQERMVYQTLFLFASAISTESFQGQHLGPINLSCSSTTGVTPPLCVSPAGFFITAALRCVPVRMCTCVHCVYVGVQYVWPCMVHVSTYVIYCATLYAILTPQTKAKSLPHPGWEKMVYFVCSSFDLRAPAAGNKWSTQKELIAEAELEVKEVKQLVQEYINKLPHKRKVSSARKTTSSADPPAMDLSSICVMFPTRLTVSACVQWSGQICIRIHAYSM